MITTERLYLRQWKLSDFPAFAELNADAEVMRFFPSLLNTEESNWLAQYLTDLISNEGWGMWAVELKASGEFIGFIGLRHLDVDSGVPLTPLVEIGWRLASPHWGRGYATEGAIAAMDYAFDTLRLEEVFAQVTVPNLPSQRVMDKLGMYDYEHNFDHPKYPPDNYMKTHRLYRITKAEWHIHKRDRGIKPTKAE